VDVTVRRAFVGYRVAPTLALFEALEQEAKAAKEQRDAELRAVSKRLDEAMSTLREAEGQFALEQESQRVLLALLDELGVQGARDVESAKTAFADEEANLLGRIAQREIVLGQRRRLLQTLQGQIAATIEDALAQIESAERDEDKDRDKPDPAEPAPERGESGGRVWA